MSDDSTPCRGHFVFRDGKLIPYEPPIRPISPTVITDDMPQGVWHPANGRWYTSKSKFRKTTKAAGCVEVGNEKLEPRKEVEDTTVRQSLLETYERLHKP